MRLNTPFYKRTVEKQEQDRNCPLCMGEMYYFPPDVWECATKACAMCSIPVKKEDINVMKNQLAKIRKQERIRIFSAFSYVFQKAKMTEEQAEYFLKEYSRIEKEQLGD